MKKKMMVVSCIALLAAVARGAPPSFHDTSSPEGWAIVKGQAEGGNLLQSKGGAPLELQTTAALPLPVEATFRFRLPAGNDQVIVEVGPVGDDQAPPLLQVEVRRGAQNTASVRALADGKLISREVNHTGQASSGGLSYTWRFPRVQGLWDDRDRSEIGADYADLLAFDEKPFVLRLVFADGSRQIWLDDRLVGEARAGSPREARFAIRFSGSAGAMSADFRAPEPTGPYAPLKLNAWSHDRRDPVVEDSACRLVTLGHRVPMWMPEGKASAVDLGRSLFRYRLTHGAGPNAGYVNGATSWPSPFTVDPVRLTFRVPFRHYQTVWLLAWVDEQPHAVPSGNLLLYRSMAGYPVNHRFEISEEAIQQGLVVPLEQRTPEGKPLYLVKIPLDENAIEGSRDMADAFLDMELTKPVSLMRTYPDPIYYGYHAAGWPSSVRVAAITLEEAPFGYELRPAQFGHVFERPERPSYEVVVTNTTDRRLTAGVTLRTRSFDGTERGGARGRATIPPRGTGIVKLDFDLRRLGWHEVAVEVEAGGTRRGHTQALVLLPPNTRTYGYAPNETRFGSWPMHTTHYDPFVRGNPEEYLELLRRLGVRRFAIGLGGVTPDLMRKYDFLPRGNHTGSISREPFRPDGTVDVEIMAEVVRKRFEEEARFPDATFYYGGEWHVSMETGYSPWPLYTGEGLRELTDDERANVDSHIKMWTAYGRAIREQYPHVQLVLQWGTPLNTIAYMRGGMSKELVDLFGMDSPQFELLPEMSNVTWAMGSWLWMVYREAERLGWPRLPMAWMEGPFYPTQPGALTEIQQANYHVRGWLVAMANGVELFDTSLVPFDAGNYYGAEHYGAGIFHRTPLEHPKPAVAAVATATTMLCGADVVGPVDTGCLTTYCLAFRHAKDRTMRFALWRINGSVEATLRVHGERPTVTDAMGNATPCLIKDSAITMKLSSSPVWLTGVEQIDGFAFAAPRYTEAAAKITRPLAPFTADQWAYDGAEDKAYAYNHFGIRRIPDANLKAEFGQGEEGHADAVAITLPVEPGDRPLATRYGQLKLRKPVTIPGKAASLGLWIKGNSSWGRVVYQCRDANGETWTSVGTKDDWNCDDAHAWSYVSFEGWRYVRFPLPGNKPWDCARDLEVTWWGSRGGDGIVDLPLTLEKIIVEARNEVPVLGEMKLVPERSYKLSGLVAEYDTEESTTDKPVAANKIRMPLPEWAGPTQNPIARLALEGVGPAPAIKEFVEPQHFNDGRSMLIRFAQDPALTYNLYLSRFPDGRGADLLVRGAKDNQSVTGFRPETKMYLFLTAVNAETKESKPSAAFGLITHDNFAEK